MSLGCRLESCSLCFSACVSWLLSPSARVLSSLYSCCRNKKRRKNLLWFSLGFVSLIAGRWGGKRQQPLTFPGATFVVGVAGASSTSCPHHGAHHISSLKNTRPQRPVFCWDFFVTWLDSHCPINHPPLFDTQQIYGSGLMKPKGN